MTQTADLDFLADQARDLATRISGEDNLKLRMMHNALSIIARDIRLSPVIRAAEAHLLDVAGVPDMLALQSRIRIGAPLDQAAHKALSDLCALRAYVQNPASVDAAARVRIEAEHLNEEETG